MSADGFELFVGLHDEICRLCSADRFDEFRMRQPQERYLAFPADFSPSQILPLGAAVTSITGVPEDFGNASDRQEPDAMLFVDRLTAPWVEAVATLPRKASGEIERLWIANCVADEGETPSWAGTSRAPLIERFLELCSLAVTTRSDLVMMWRL